MSEDLEPTSQDLLALYDLKYCRRGVPGWGPRMRVAFDYFSPDDYYEALLAKLINAGASGRISAAGICFPQIQPSPRY